MKSTKLNSSHTLKTGYVNEENVDGEKNSWNQNALLFTTFVFLTEKNLGFISLDKKLTKKIIKTKRSYLWLNIL